LECRGFASALFLALSAPHPFRCARKKYEKRQGSGEEICISGEEMRISSLPDLVNYFCSLPSSHISQNMSTNRSVQICMNLFVYQNIALSILLNIADYST